MITIDIDQASIKAITRKLGLKQKQTEEKIKAGLIAGSFLIVNEAKLIVAVDTHTLQRSIHNKTVKTLTGGFSVQIGTNVKYGIDIEFGGSKQSPKGFMRPALDEKGEDAIREIISSLRQIL